MHQRFRGVLIGLVAVVWSTGIAVAQTRDWTFDIREQHRNETVLIEVQDSGGEHKAIGSGVVVSDRGHILTNYHVLEAGERLHATSWWATAGARGGQDRRKKLESPRDDLRDRRGDLALLQAVGAKPGWKHARVRGDLHIVDPSVALVALGFPGNDDLSHAAGRFDQFMVDGGRWRVTMDLTHGMSGGPVLDRTGTVVAIVVGGSAGDIERKTVIPSHLARALFQRAGIAFADSGPVAPTPPPTTSTKPTLFVDPTISGPQGTEHIAGLIRHALDDFLNNLTGLQVVLDPRDQQTAQYALTNFRVKILRHQNGFEIRAKFRRLEYESDVPGFCHYCNDAQGAGEMLLARLLESTLFDERGPYGGLTIDRCDAEANSVILTLSWPRGPGIELYLFAEIADTRSKDLLHLKGVFLSPQLPAYEVHANTVKARFWIYNGDHPNTEEFLRRCVSSPERVNSALLLRMIPLWGSDGRPGRRMALPQ